MPRDNERIARTQAALREEQLDALVCARPSNVLLLTGYWPVVGTSLAIAARDGTVTLVVPADEEDLARAGGYDELRCFEAGSLERLLTTVAAVEPAFQNALRRVLPNGGRVGWEALEAFEPASYVGMHSYGSAIAELLNGAGATPVAADDMLMRLRSVKTGTEIERIARACRIGGLAFRLGVAQLTPGLSEADAAVRFSAPLTGVGTGYDNVERAGGLVSCMSGANAGRADGAYARSRAKTLAEGELVLTHCNSYADGYWTDITRTYSLGAPSDRARAMYRAVFAARAAALAAVCPGTRASDVDRAARDVMREHGFGDAFKHPTGHGTGFAAIDHHARPRLHPASPDVLETGMVFNIEPGAYFPGWGGMRHCDMVAVTPNGAELLTPFFASENEVVL